MDCNDKAERPKAIRIPEIFFIDYFSFQEKDVVNEDIPSKGNQSAAT